MRKKFHYEDFKEHLKNKGADFTKPFALSLDCDQTLVDRSRGAHFLSGATLKAFGALKRLQNVKMIINTGRDASAYEPLCKQLDHSAPCLFVSGRVAKWDNQCLADPQALFPYELKTLLWNAFVDGKLPFLDVKHSGGNVFFLKSAADQAYIAPYRPLDWFNDIELKIEVGCEAKEKEQFLALDVVRLDLPLFQEVCQTTFLEIKKKNNQVAKQWIQALLGPELFFYPITAIPALTSSSRSHLMPSVTTVRLMIKNQHVNKGTGLKRFLADFNIPETNLISCGDSNEETANDVIVKEVLPQSTLVLIEKIIPEENLEGDFWLPPATEDGIVELLEAMCKL